MFFTELRVRIVGGFGLICGSSAQANRNRNRQPSPPQRFEKSKQKPNTEYTEYIYSLPTSVVKFITSVVKCSTST